MKALVLTCVMLFALATPAIAAEGKLLEFNFNGLELSIQLPTLDDSRIPITASVDPCKIFGDKFNKLLGDGFSCLGLGLCSPE